MLTCHEARLLPDGALLEVAEGVLWADDLVGLALAEAASPTRGYGYPQRWTTGLAATEGDQTPGG